jgi:hypothetical protein
MAGGQMVRIEGIDLACLRDFAAAAVDGHGAAWVEGAALDAGEQRRPDAGMPLKLPRRSNEGRLSISARL